MPTGAIVEENPLNDVALLSIPPNTVARDERFWPLPKAALIISFQPHMHFRGTRMLLEAIHPDGRREVLTTHSTREYRFDRRVSGRIVAAFEALELHGDQVGVPAVNFGAQTS